MGCQSAPDDFDLGKLRHPRPKGRSGR
jgi:hypothetical protein